MLGLWEVEPKHLQQVGSHLRKSDTGKKSQAINNQQIFNNWRQIRKRLALEHGLGEFAGDG